MSDVVLFPPLPPMPAPPVAPLDERQQTFYRITSRLVEQLARQDGEVTYVDTTHGFRASAVDLGALQDLIEEALARFEMSQVRERWDVDVRTWIGHTIVSWISAAKSCSSSSARPVSTSSSRLRTIAGTTNTSSTCFRDALQFRSGFQLRDAQRVRSTPKDNSPRLSAGGPSLP